MTEFTFLKADKSNAEFVFEAIQKIYQVKLLKDKFMEMYEFRISDSNSYVIIAFDEFKKPQGLIIGYRDVLLNLNYFSATITDFYILPNSRKQNLASLLYDNFEQELSKQGIYNINVNCNITGTLTQNFYRRKGFTYTKKTFSKTIY